MGAPTVVEVGVESSMKEDYINLQREVAELSKKVQEAQATLVSFAEKKAKGARFTQEQVTTITLAVKGMEANKRILEEKNKQFEDMKQQVEAQRSAVVEVTGEVYPGTTIVIGDVSMNVKSSYSYCRFVRSAGEVKMAPL